MQLTKNGKILEKIKAWKLTRVRNKNEVIADARNEGRTVHFAELMGLCYLDKSKWNHSFRNTNVESYSEVKMSKMILVRMQYSLNKDHQHLKMKAANVN